MAEVAEKQELTNKDFSSDQLVRWCPGCGDYAILSAVQKAMPTLGIPKEKFVFLSGIECAARFPYYMNTYGFHTIHGRAPAFATGMKLSNPELSVWMITGDGDSMAIGGNHFIHCLRRNVNIQVLLFNNEIYGLTKGQYSPTSKKGTVTKSTPYGSAEQPFSPGELALGAKASFFMRTIDTNPKLMAEHFAQAAQHEGTSLVEILQNCIIFNKDVHAPITERSTAADNQIHLEHGKPMIFGADSNKGLLLDGMKLKVVTIGEDGITEGDILVHDAHEADPTLHNMLIRMGPINGFPGAMGIIRQVDMATYDSLMKQQAEDSAAKAKSNTMDELLSSGNTWVVD